MHVWGGVERSILKRMRDSDWETRNIGLGLGQRQSQLTETAVIKCQEPIPEGQSGTINYRPLTSWMSWWLRFLPVHSCFGYGFWRSVTGWLILQITRWRIIAVNTFPLWLLYWRRGKKLFGFFGEAGKEAKTVRNRVSRHPYDPASERSSTHSRATEERN